MEPNEEAKPGSSNGAQARETVGSLAESYFLDKKNHQRRDTETVDMELEELELLYGAQHVLMLFLPVTICMIVVCITIGSISFFSKDDGQYLVYTPFHPDDEDSGAITFFKSILNTLIVLAVVVVMTFVLVVLYKFRCYKLLHGWIMLSSLMLLFLFALIYAQEFLKAYNIPTDQITMVFCLYNFGVTGMVSIHWKAPLKLQQAYLITSATLMSLIFIKHLPEWTLWLVLAIIACWDLVAVLCPGGPLRMLVETAQERGETLMPALIYSSTVMYSYMPIMTGAADASGSRANQDTGNTIDRTISNRIQEEVEMLDQPGNPADGGGSIGTDADPNDVGMDENGQGRVRRTSTERSVRIEQLRHSIEEEERGVKLGLGDFIFYSVLVGKAASYGDITTIIACFLAILMGLFLTLTILVTVKKALPALPISIFFGLAFNFGTRYCISPLVNEFAAQQLFI